MDPRLQQWMQMIDQRTAAIENGTHPALQQILARSNSAAQAARQTEKLFLQTEKHTGEITALLKNLQVRGGTQLGVGESDRYQYIEDVPGRRVPFDLLTEIPIDADVTTKQEKAIPISNAGPFVARGRYISFYSQYRFTVTDPESGTSANFAGRSFGRFRAPHSAADYMDGHLPPVQQFVGAAPGGGNGLWPSTVVHSPYRTMQPDARIEVTIESDGFPRQNIPVPSAFWTTNINSPFPLPAMDFFDRNQSIVIALTPLHVNNPDTAGGAAVGNLTAFPGIAPYPFLGQQYDHHEGIVDPYSVGVAEDPVTRLPSGVFVIGFSGFRILDAPGAIGGIAQ